MHLSWNEVRARAAAFAEEWKDAHYEKGETQSFYNDFFEVFGVRRRRVASYEEPVKLLGNRRGYIDLFWKGVLLVEQKSAGRALSPAKTQALEYFPGLKDAELPRYILLSDFQRFELYDLDTDDAPVVFNLSQLPQKVEAFGFILGVQKRTFREQDPANIEAAELMGLLHDELEASGYRGASLERLLVRLLFCLFAEHTGIFEPGDFLSLIQDRTNQDGSDLGLWLTHLFEVLNTPKDERQRNLDTDLSRFEYINGDLFSERLAPASFNSEMRNLLMQACGFRWSVVSPAIFGSLFQFVMNPTERRAQGAHYTSERDILKVIEPLFLDELKSELDHARQLRRGRDAALHRLQDKIAVQKFFDPACGCGNFLVIAYRELRAIEIEILKELFPDRRQRRLDVSALSHLNVDQFYGIELDEFASRIAEVALWLTDHIMNNQLSLDFGEAYARIPLRATPHIHCGDALTVDWASVVPASECSFVFGNPPFRGAKFQSATQRQQVRQIAALGGSGGTLDFVAAWFLKAAAYVQAGTATVAFVATNSITQGEQVAQLWPQLFSRFQLEILFAHRTFAWQSEARGAAHVHVVIIGLVKRAVEPPAKRLFSYDDIRGDPVESIHSAISAYLVDASNLGNRHLVAQERSMPLSADAPHMTTGTQPIDNGHLIFNSEEREQFIAIEPGADRFMRPFPGTQEFLHNVDRWILALQSASPSELRAMPNVMIRLQEVSAFRRKSKRASTLDIAEYPTRFNVETIPSNPFLVVPEVSSENRDYIPIGWLQPPTVPSNKLRLIENAELWQFGILTSRMHMAWTRIVGGRLESRFQYSVGINYNCFPWPDISNAQRQTIARLAQAVLDARARFPNSSLDDLYDATAMNPALRSAHRALDHAVDRLYRSPAFESDRLRVEFLFGLYERLVSPLIARSTSRRILRRSPRATNPT